MSKKPKWLIKKEEEMAKLCAITLNPQIVESIDRIRKAKVLQDPHSFWEVDTPERVASALLYIFQRAETAIINGLANAEIEDLKRKLKWAQDKIINKESL